jgi:hypothetical protein
MKPFDYSVLKGGKVEKVRHFGGHAAAFDSGNYSGGGHKKSKHHLNLKGRALDKMKGKKKAYTGHYQEDASGKIRHQSPAQVAKKRLNQN